nr:glycosyltransferase family 2 protein [Desulfovulcanus ferrireducens]
MPDGRLWPKVSIVTPTFSQGQFLEETIRSVLLQGYPNLEYIIIDGSSSDNSVEIIEKYDRYLAYWVSESDRGQGHAISKGMHRFNGQIEAWLNSDDRYLPGCLHRVAAKFAARHDFIYGNRVVWNSDGKVIGLERLPRFHPYAYVIYTQRSLFQEACFWSKNLRQLVGWINKDLRYNLDTDWFRRLTEKCSRPCHIPEYIAGCIEHEGRKSVECDATGRALNHEEGENLLKEFLRERGISRLRHLAGWIWYVPLMRIQIGQFPLSFPRIETIKKIIMDPKI